MMNVGNPELAFDFAQIPNEGVGLARLEFVINNMIGIHPKAILDDRPGAGQSARRDQAPRPRLCHA
jgi:pyruvate,water dikinase